MTTKLAAAMLALAGTPTYAHRLDEYLQGTLLTIAKDRIQAQMTLTPGVAVFPALIESMDTDANGALSKTEQRAYAASLLGDLSLTVDGLPLKPNLLSTTFPTTDEMRDGLGEIHITFQAELPRGHLHRKMTLENHHQPAISVYLVNSLVPRDPTLQITSQSRNYSQSSYTLEYEQTASVALGADRIIWLTPIALLLCFGLAIRYRVRMNSPRRQFL